MLLLLLVRDLALVPRVAEQVQPEDFLVPTYRDIYRALIRSEGAREPSRVQGSEARPSLGWAEGLPPPLYERVQELAADPEDLTNPLAVLDDAVARLRARRLEARLTDLMTEVLVAESARAVELVSEIKGIRQELAALGSRMPGRGFFRSE